MTSARSPRLWIALCGPFWEDGPFSPGILVDLRHVHSDSGYLYRAFTVGGWIRAFRYAARRAVAVAREIVTGVRIYVAGPIADVERVQAVQCAVVAAGHELTLDWSRGPDVAFVDDYGSAPELSAKIATEDLDAVLAADAVLVVASEHDGRGMFVELGAALARAERGDLEHIVVIGKIRHESVFYHHPAVQRWSTVNEWLTSLA